MESSNWTPPPSCRRYLPSSPVHHHPPSLNFPTHLSLSLSLSSSSSTHPNPHHNLFIGDPQIIHNRTHSFISPSPRYTRSKSLPFHPQFDPDSS
ncbi:hypothetical protein HanIR_Chr17g0901831 [Helianthus annuus]|nr:hypothetical protein HanIR_Chr17g0901831 [Helianthus annuus]